MDRLMVRIARADSPASERCWHLVARVLLAHAPQSLGSLSPGLGLPEDDKDPRCMLTLGHRGPAYLYNGRTAS